MIGKVFPYTSSSSRAAIVFPSFEELDADLPLLATVNFITVVVEGEAGRSFRSLSCLLRI